MSYEILRLISFREKFYRLKKKNPSSVYCKERYEFYNSQAKLKVHKAKKKYYYELFDTEIGNPKKLWENFSEVILNKKRNQSEIKLRINDEYITDSASITNHFNDYFKSSVENLVRHLNAPDQQSFDYLQYRVTQPVNFKNILEDDICTAINNLKNRSATGYDKVSNRFLKKYSLKLQNLLTRLVNDAINKKRFPECLKFSRVTPVHKGGSSVELAHYRPISIPNSITKIFENVLNNRLELFLRSNNIISVNQFGFSRNSNTTAACLNLTNSISTEIEKRKFVSVLFLDLSKAFDLVNHQLLLMKLKRLHFNEDYILLFSDYLAERNQFVQLGNTPSTIKEVTVGVPQGSVLGPTLFKIFINDITMINLSGNIQIFADDIAIVYSDINIRSLINKMNCDLYTIQQWLDKNFLLLNVSKTKYIVFRNRTVDNTIDIIVKYDNQIITKVDSYKYLGLVSWLVLNSKFNWDLHIDQVKNKILPYIFILRKSNRYLPVSVMKKIYYSYIQSHLVYLNPIWSGATKTSLQSLFILQKRAIKNLFNLPIRTPSESLFDEFLPLSRLIYKELLLVTQKVVFNLIKHKYLVIKVGEIHEYNTRRRSNIRIPLFTTSASNNDVFYRGLLFYNRLSAELRHERDPKIFKKMVLEFVKENISIFI